MPSIPPPISTFVPSSNWGEPMAWPPVTWPRAISKQLKCCPARPGPSSSMNFPACRRWNLSSTGNWPRIRSFPSMPNAGRSPSPSCPMRYSLSMRPGNGSSSLRVPSFFGPGLLPPSFIIWRRPKRQAPARSAGSSLMSCVTICSWTGPPGPIWSWLKPSGTGKEEAASCGPSTGPRPAWAAGSFGPGWSSP